MELNNAEIQFVREFLARVKPYGRNLPDNFMLVSVDEIKVLVKVSEMALDA